ncbi:MAG: PfkB family carbohydrate kinase, partial [Longicatena sp.]
GVDVSLVDICKTKTGHALIQVNCEGENCIILYHGANKSIQKKDIDKVLDHFEANDYIILQNEISNLEHILSIAHEKGLTIVFNPAPYTKSIKSLPLDYVSYMILNESEAKGLASCESIEKAMEHLKETYPDTRFVITLGADGCYFFDKGKTIYQKAYDVPVVDTTAAGDTFIGYFIGSIIKSCSIEESLEIASKASALAIMQKGASNAIPSIDVVLRERFK